MVGLKNYNPCGEYINELKAGLSRAQKADKNIIIKYDKFKFITNLTSDDIADISINNSVYNDKGLLVIIPENIFFAEGINACPSFAFVKISNIDLSSIIKRMYAQIEFGCYNSNKISDDEISMCDNIFKSIYTSSVSIKRDNINQCMEKYNELQKQNYVNKKVIDGIIYAAYDLYNSLNK